MTEREKKEIEEKLEIMTPFLQLEFLEKKLNEVETFDIKRFIHQKLAKLYFEKKMFNESGKHMENSAETAITRKEKRNDYMRALEMYTRVGDFEKSELIMNKALALVDQNEQLEMKALRKQFLMSQAERFELKGKNNNALKVYEFVFRICDDAEREKLKDKLIELYEKLGKIREANSLKGI